MYNRKLGNIFNTADTTAVETEMECVAAEIKRKEFDLSRTAAPLERQELHNEENRRKFNIRMSRQTTNYGIERKTDEEIKNIRVAINKYQIWNKKKVVQLKYFNFLREFSTVNSKWKVLGSSLAD